MKLVINRGSGYDQIGLSHEAIMMWCAAKGIFVECQVRNGTKYWPYGMRRYWTLPWEAIEAKLEQLPISQRAIYLEEVRLNMDSVARNDEVLVSVVESLKDRASAVHAHLTVIEIPDGIDWVLMREYAEGPEYIAEKHRTWGKPE